MPDIDSNVWQKYAGKGVLVYGLHPNESPKALADFISQTGVTFPIVADAPRTLSQFAFPAGVGYPYPRDVVIGKDLRIRSIRNSFNVVEMTQLVERLLAE